MANFTQVQMSVAKTIWNTLKLYNYSDVATASVIGNLYAESALNPNVNEHSGGGGYGLGQWTPKSNLYSQAAVCGISNTEAETTQGQARIIAQGDKTGQWSLYGNTAYHNTVKNQQSLSEFKQSSNVTAAAANFCAHWERPSVQYAHMNVRIDAANSIYQLLKGSSEEEKKEGGTTMQCIYWKPINSTDFGAYYFNGAHTAYIKHPDSIVILKDIYYKNNGRHMPEYTKEQWNPTTPWYDRLEAIAPNR